MKTKHFGMVLLLTVPLLLGARGYDDDDKVAVAIAARDAFAKPAEIEDPDARAAVIRLSTVLDVTDMGPDARAAVIRAAFGGPFDEPVEITEKDDEIGDLFD